MPDTNRLPQPDIEADLIQAIRQQPAQRAGFVALAQFLESIGSIEESNLVYRGNLPRSIQERHGLNPYPHRTTLKMPTCQRLGWYGTETYSLDAPLNSDPARNSFFLATQVRTAPEYIDMMQNCTLVFDGKNKLYLDEDGVTNAEHSTVNAYLLAPRASSTTEATHLQGTSILLAGRNSNNFYHWHYDCLPALGLAQSAGIRISDIDHILMDDRDRGFQLQMLTAAGVREDQIKFIDVENCHFTCDQMLMVRIQNQQGMAQSRRHLDWIRKTFLPNAGKGITGTQQPLPSRIAIKRDVRGFRDPKMTYRLLAQKGYTEVQLEKFSYMEQISLFAGATHIVAPHGAGLSLLAFARHGTVVHEFHGDHVQPCFWSISSALGLKYHCYNCSHITDKEIASSNKFLSERLLSLINVSPELLASIPD